MDCTSIDFCMLTNEPFESSYNFSSMVGFGKPDGTYESLMDSVIGEYWDDSEYRPMATFDLNFNGTDSMVTIGDWSDDSMTLFMTTNSTALSTYWAMAVQDASYAGSSYSDFTIAAATINSEYPYIALPSDMFATAK